MANSELSEADATYASSWSDAVSTDLPGSDDVVDEVADECFLILLDYLTCTYLPYENY